MPCSVEKRVYIACIMSWISADRRPASSKSRRIAVKKSLIAPRTPFVKGLRSMPRRVRPALVRNASRPMTSNSALVCWVNTVRSAVKRCKPRSKSSFSSVTRSIMCRTTSWFLPRSSRNSASCSAMLACRASSIARTPAASAWISACAAAPTICVLGGNEPAGQCLLERRQAALPEERVVAIDLGQQPFLRRHGKDLGGRDVEHRCRRGDLPVDLGIDGRLRLELVPQAVDLVQDHDPSGLLSRAVAGEIALPHVEIGLRHAGVGSEDEHDDLRAGQEAQRELGFRSDGVEPRRVEDHETLLQQRMGEVDDRVAPARHFDAILVAARHAVGGARPLFVLQSERPRKRDRHALDFRDPGESLAHLARVRQIERKRRPFVGVAPELVDRRVLEARLDRQQADGRRARRVVEKLGGAHRGAACRRGQQARPEVGEEDRVDELGFAAGELGDERHHEPVLMQALEHLLDFEIDLRIGEVLLAQPLVQRGNAERQPLAPVAVGFEAGRKLTGLNHSHACRSSYRDADADADAGAGAGAGAGATIYHGRRDGAPARNGSSLAARAIRGGSSALPDFANGGAARPAGQPPSAIDGVIELEIARLATAVDVVAQRRSAFGDGVGKRRADRTDEPFQSWPRQAIRRCGRPDPRPEQRFAGVDIADADDQMIVHQRKLDRCAAAARRAPKVVRVAGRVERFGAEPGQEGVRLGRRRQPEHRAEAARVVVTQRHPGIEDDVDMVMQAARRRLAERAQAAGHPKMDQQGVGAEAEQQVFAAPMNGIHGTPGDARREPAGNRPAQPAVVYVHDRHPAGDHEREDPSQRGFDFG